MKNMKIGKKLIVTFGVVIAMFLLTVVTSIVGLSYSGSQFKDFYTYSYPLSNQTVELRRAIQTGIKSLSMSMLTEDEAATEKYIADVEKQMGTVNEIITYLKENYRGDQSNIEAAYQLLLEAKDYRVRLQELTAKNNNTEAAFLFFNEYAPRMEQIQEKITAMDATTTELADSTYASAASVQTLLTILAIVLSIVVLLLTVCLALNLTRSLTKPLGELEDAAKQMVDGSLSVEIEYESGDEMGGLSASMRALCGNFKDIIADIGHILEELANGNFHITSGCVDNYRGDYVPILNAMRLIRDNLNNALTQINQSSDQVALGSAQLAESAQSLAEGATEQAGAVEELTATVENVSAMAEDGAKSTQVAYERVHAAELTAEGSQEDLKALTGAMVRISDTSKEIQNIIASIEDIASQTNLLSLNASIEAARAGEAGRGFAVVADQIGKLASDSAQSAVSTRELIVKSLEEIEDGNQITARTVEVIKDVLTSMQEFAELAKDSSDSSKQQAEMLKQVEQGIEQISRVVQNNSAAAQESSATSEELSAQAEELKRQVQKFQLLDQA